MLPMDGSNGILETAEIDSCCIGFHLYKRLFFKDVVIRQKVVVASVSNLSALFIL